LISLPVNGSCAGFELPDKPTGVVEGVVAGGAAAAGTAVAAATGLSGGAGGGVEAAVVVVIVVVGGSLVAPAEGGTVGVGVTPAQSSILCWYPRLGTHGGPT